MSFKKMKGEFALLGIAAVATVLVWGAVLSKTPRVVPAAESSSPKVPLSVAMSAASTASRSHLKSTASRSHLKSTASRSPLKR